MIDTNLWRESGKLRMYVSEWIWITSNLLHYFPISCYISPQDRLIHWCLVPFATLVLATTPVIRHRVGSIHVFVKIWRNMGLSS